MKRTVIFCTICLLVIVAYSQELPSVQIKTIDGKTVNSNVLKENDGKPIVLCFWATWCGPCIKEMTVLNENYEEWAEETGVKIIAISIDDSRTSNRVKPFVDARNWDFDVYLDVNSDLKRAMNVNNPPHTILLDGNGKIVWQHISYSDGDEEELYQKIKVQSAK
ncbi:MAG: TlpA family protein disulfide reductase [Bacteroidales bacterium]|jgi:peroxiredoxin|nr:TlpA family protein disulfide reductase [Bacteroidales bacterium]